MTPIRGSLRGRLVRFVVLTGLVVATTACADKDTVADAPEIPGPAYSGTVRVSALDNIYRPEALKVVTDTEVVWSNDGRNDHNVIPNESKDDFGVETADFAPGKEHSATFGTPGTYRYFCSLHATATAGSMRGSVVVLDADSATDVVEG
jgi:plastocyanin